MKFRIDDSLTVKKNIGYFLLFLLVPSEQSRGENAKF